MKTKILLLVVMAGAVATSMAQGYTPHELNALRDSLDSNPTRVLAWAKNALADNPKCADAYTLCGAAYMAGQNYRDALAALDEALRLHSKKSVIGKDMIYLYRAQLYEQVAEYALAEADYNAAVKQKQHNLLSAYSLRADFYIRRGEYSRAEADYRACLEQNPADDQALHGLINSLIGQKQYAEAGALLDKRIRFEPKHAFLYYLRAMVCLHAGHYEQYVDDVLRYAAIDRHVAVSQAVSLLIVAPDYAVGKLSELIASDPTDAYWLQCRIGLYIDMQQYSEALSDLEVMESAFGVDAYTCYAKSLCYGGLYEFNNQISMLDTLMAHEGTDAALLLERGLAYRNKGQTEAALRDFDNAIQRNATYAPAYVERSITYDMQEQFAEALKDINVAVRYAPNESYCYLKRGQIHMALGDTLAAKLDFRTALDHDSTSFVAAFAWALLGQGDKAVQMQQQIVTDTGNRAGEMYNMACLYALLDRKQEAIDTLGKAVDAGYKNYYHIDHDRDLVNIRNEKGYKDILQTLTQQKLNSLFQKLAVE